MYRQFSYSGELTFFQKLRSFDYLLMMCVLFIGIISTFSMYSSEGGQFLYYTKSHLIRFSVFFLLMLVLSFIRPTFWHSTGYLFYLVVLGLLFYASLYGIKVPPLLVFPFFEKVLPFDTSILSSSLY